VLCDTLGAMLLSCSARLNYVASVTLVLSAAAGAFSAP
jgi:hypothetical protein